MHEMIAAFALARQGRDSSRATILLGYVQLESFARVRRLRFSHSVRRFQDDTLRVSTHSDWTRVKALHEADTKQEADVPVLHAGWNARACLVPRLYSLLPTSVSVSFVRFAADVAADKRPRPALTQGMMVTRSNVGRTHSRESVYLSRRDSHMQAAKGMTPHRARATFQVYSATSSVIAAACMAAPCHAEVLINRTNSCITQTGTHRRHSRYLAQHNFDISTLLRCFSPAGVAPEVLGPPDTVRCPECDGGFGFARRARSAHICVLLIPANPSADLDAQLGACRNPLPALMTS